MSATDMLEPSIEIAANGHCVCVWGSSRTSVLPGSNARCRNALDSVFGLHLTPGERGRNPSAFKQKHSEDVPVIVSDALNETARTCFGRIHRRVFGESGPITRTRLDCQTAVSRHTLNGHGRTTSESSPHRRQVKPLLELTVSFAVTAVVRSGDQLNPSVSGFVSRPSKEG